MPCVVPQVFIIDAWANILVYPTISAPNYPAGFKVAAAFAVACMGFTGLFWLMERRTRASRAEVALEEEELERRREVLVLEKEAVAPA